MLRAQLRSTLFPYTTLFRSGIAGIAVRMAARVTKPVPVTPEPPFEARSAKSKRPEIWSKLRCVAVAWARKSAERSEEHTSELQSLTNLVCRLLLEKKKEEKQ